jgi:hypothetical protein
MRELKTESKIEQQGADEQHGRQPELAGRVPSQRQEQQAGADQRQVLKQHEHGRDSFGVVVAEQAQSGEDDRQHRRHPGGRTGLILERIGEAAARDDRAGDAVVLRCQMLVLVAVEPRNEWRNVAKSHSVADDGGQVGPERQSHDRHDHDDGPERVRWTPARGRHLITVVDDDDCLDRLGCLRCFARRRCGVLVHHSSRTYLGAGPTFHYVRRTIG